MARRLPFLPEASTTARLARRVELELLPLHPALAGMHVVSVLLRFVTPMAFAVGGDLLLHAAPCPRLIGFHLQAPDGCRLRLHAGPSMYPPRATRSALAPRWQGVARWARVPLLVRTGILAALDPVEVAWLQRLEPFLDLGMIVTLAGADLGLLRHLEGPGP